MCKVVWIPCFIARPGMDIYGGHPVTAAYASVICSPCGARCAGSRHFGKDDQLRGKSALEAELRDGSGINPRVIML